MARVPEAVKFFIDHHGNLWQAPGVPMKMTLGQRVRKLRRQRGFTLAEFGRRVHLSKQRVQQVELEPGDRAHRMAWLKRLARALGCSVEYLLGLTEDSNA